MKKNKFIAEVLRKRLDLLNLDTYFYVSPVDCILSGFLCETTPRGAYVWRFIYPLFDRNENLTLLYSKRLDYPEGYIDYRKIPKNKLSDEFLLRIDKHVADTSNYLTVEGFYNYICEVTELSKNAYVQKAMGACMLLMGDKKRASNHLRIAAASPAAMIKNDFRTECDQLMTLMEDDIEGAQRLILSWKDEMKERLGLS